VGTSRHLGYGQGEHVIDVELVTAAAVSAALDATFGSPEYRPPFLPAVALQVYELTRPQDVDIGAVCAAIETDALLSADVLRLTETGSLARATPCRSVREAAMRLGTQALRDHVFRVSLETRVFRSTYFQSSMESLRVHSIAVGTVARRVMEETSHSTEFAFLAGVLHDIGVAAGLIVFSEWEKAGRYPGDEVAIPALMEVHAQAGEQIATLWNLPLELRWIVGAHHTGKIGTAVHPVASACIVAESIVNDLGLGLCVGAYEVDVVHPLSLGSAIESLGLEPKVLERLRHEAAELLS
jgi:putative nucleotidyltransferase with HDIG domain